MSRSAKVYMHKRFAGVLRQSEDGYSFNYTPDYLNSNNPIPISLTLPLQKEAYHNTIFFPFFDGLIPEGWHLEVEKEPHSRDRMGLLLALCKDCIGAVSIVPEEEVNHE